MTARMYIWPRYALEVAGQRVEFFPLEGAIVARLYRSIGHPVHSHRLIAAIYGHAEDGGPLGANDCIRHAVGRARQRIEAAGVHATIFPNMGRDGGYMLAAEGTAAPADVSKTIIPRAAYRGNCRYVSEAAWEAMNHYYMHRRARLRSGAHHP